MSENVIANLGNTYHAWIRKHPDAVTQLAAEIEDLLGDAGVTFDRVTARIKTWESLKAKAKKTTPAGEPVYPDPWTDIHDIVGVRVTTFHSTEIPIAVDVLTRSFTLLRSVNKTAQTQIAGDFGYGSHHLILEIPEGTDGLDDLAGTVFEVQIRTVLQHAWAEFEHDIRYKRGAEDLDPKIDRAFTLAAGLIELADQQFDQIAALQQPGGTGTSDDVELTPETLPGVLSMLMGTKFAPSRSDSYRWLHQLLELNGITTVKQLREVLTVENLNVVSQAMKYRYQPGQVRIIDDILLYLFGDKHIERTADTGNRPKARADRLPARLQLLQDAGVLSP